LLTKRIVVASMVSMVALAIVCGLGLGSLRRLSLQNDAEMAQRLALLDESEVFQLLLYQKGFAVDFMFTGDERWLRELDQGRREFADWLTQADRTADTAEERHLLERIRRDYRQLDAEHTAMIASFRRGESKEVRLQHQRIYSQLNDLVHLSEEFVRTSAAQAREERARVQHTLRRDTTLLVSSSLLGMITSLLVGFLVARRVARPIYELQLQVASAAQRIRIEVPPGRAGFEALGEHMSAILRKIEETDAAIAEQRRRLIQSEKMSAIGEVAAKLAHEILNPLTGIKAAVQLLARSRSDDDSPSAQAARDTAQVVSQEIARVEQLVRRMLTYARPLAPRLSSLSVPSLLSMAHEASRPALATADSRLRSRAESLLTSDGRALLWVVAGVVICLAAAWSANRWIRRRMRRRINIGLAGAAAVAVVGSLIGITQLVSVSNTASSTFEGSFRTARLLVDARAAAFTPVVDQAKVADKEFLAVFAASKKDAAVNQRVTALEDHWNSSARQNYERARSLAEQALAAAR
jgi:signal transduction histidine kinase